MPRQWCDCSDSANRAVKANELSPLSDEEESAFFHAFSTVPPCETEEPRKMTADEKREETEETAEAVRSILSSTSILCEFKENTNLPKCQCGHPAQTRPVRFIKVDGDVDDDNDDDDDDDELWPACKGNYPSTHCFICAAKDGRQFLKNPSSCECGMEAFNHSHKICRKCAKELNEQKDCSNIGCDKKRHLIHSTCKNHYQRPGEMVVCCEICGEARSLQVRSPKGKKMNVCTRFQNEACFLLCKAKNSSGERCPKPRYRSVEKYKTFCGSKKCKSGLDFKLRRS